MHYNKIVMKKMDRRYKEIFLACCLFILSIGLNNAYSIFVVPLADMMNVGRGTITLASTITDLISGTLSPLLITLLKRTELKKLLAASTIAYALIILCVGIYTNVYMYFILNIIKGVVLVVYGVNIIVIILGNWFEKGRQTLTGIALAFTGIGGALFSQIFDYIMNISSIRVTFMVFAALTLILALPAIGLLKLTPEEDNLSILKDENIKEEKKTVSRNRVFTLNDPVFIGICVVFFIMTFLTNVSIHFPGYAETIGMGHIGASMVSWMMIGSIFFKMGMGYVCDKFGPKSGYPVAITTVALSFILIIYGKSEMALLAGSFIFGGIFATLIILNPMIRYCFSDEQYPEVFAKVMVVSAISNIGGPLVGYLYDFTGTYVSSLYMALIMCIIALAVYFITIHIAERD